MDDQNFQPDRTLEPDDGLHWPREMTAEELVEILGNGIRELPYLEFEYDEERPWLARVCVADHQELAVCRTHGDPPEYHEDVAHAIANAPRIVDSLRAEVDRLNEQCITENQLREAAEVLLRQAEAREKALREARGTCAWTEDDDGAWETECGGIWEFVDGGPEENEARYCFRCGGEIVVVGADERKDGGE